MILMSFLDFVDLQHLLDRQVRSGQPPGWPPAPSLAGVRERVGTGSTSRDRLPLRPSPPELQLIRVDGDDDQPPQCGCYFVLSVNRT